MKLIELMVHKMVILTILAGLCSRNLAENGKQQLLTLQMTESMIDIKEKIQVVTPDNDTLSVFIIEKKIAESLIQKDSVSIHSTYKMAFEDFPIFKFKGNNGVLIKYTFNEYYLYIENINDLGKIITNGRYRPIIIHKHNHEYFYQFTLKNEYFRTTDISQLEKIKNYEDYVETYYDPNGEKVYGYPYKKNSNIIFITEIKKNKYMGSWYPNFKHFKYFFENGY